jgi:hypothetical protein
MQGQPEGKRRPTGGGGVRGAALLRKAPGGGDWGHQDRGLKARGEQDR